MNPDKYTNQEFFLDVGDGHQIYVMDWGNPKAQTPILFLHGGPGSGCSDKHKRQFDPETQRVIFHDQRGAGKSLPKGSLKNNTTKHLIADIEKLIHKLELKRFVIVGGSWGSTLALAYAIEHPSKAAGLLISGVHTATPAENNWLLRGGWRFFFPELWDKYAAGVPQEHQDDPSAYYIQQALGEDSEAAKQAAYQFTSMQGSLLKMDDQYPAPDYETYDADPGRIELHYLSNESFMPKGHLLKNASKLKMPVYIVQGRYDMVCPPIAAHTFSQHLSKSKLIWTINGHSKQHESKNISSILLEQLLGEV